MPPNQIRSTRARALSADAIRITFNFVGDWSWEATLTTKEVLDLVTELKGAVGVAGVIRGGKTHV